MENRRPSSSETVARLRDALEAARSAPSALGWQSEQWLGARERMLSDIGQLLSPESIEAESRVRDDVPLLLARLTEAVLGRASA